MTLQVSERTIRPAAVLPVDRACQIVRALEERDVSKGGVWNASAGVWQRYDKPWDGAAGSRGTARLIGTIAVIYDRPRRNEITVYKAGLTEDGLEQGWTTDKLCDDALAYANLSLNDCPRDDMQLVPPPDPFPKPGMPRQRTSGINEILRTDVRDLLATDVRELVAKLRGARAS